MAVEKQFESQGNCFQSAFDFSPALEQRNPADDAAPQAHARRTHPQTSHAAAASVHNIRESQAYVFSFFKSYGPMTDEQLQARISRANSGTSFQTVKLSPSGIRTRRSELVTLGMLRDTGERFVLQSG